MDPEEMFEVLVDRVASLSASGERKTLALHQARKEHDKEIANLEARESALRANLKAMQKELERVRRAS